MNDAVTVKVEPILVLREGDFDERVKGTIAAKARGATVLGSEEGAQQALFDAIPSVIARRVQAIIPSTFVISAIEIAFKLGGNLFGVELGGDVKVKLAPKR